MPDWAQQILVAVIVLVAVVMLARKTARSLFGKGTAGHGGGCGGGCEDCPSISAPEPSRLIQLEIQPPRNQTAV